MKFSIIVPVYNVERFLPKCLESILNQDFEDYEIIAVNDGSTDGSADILEKYASEIEKLNVIHQENKGLGGARNTGIANANGEYLVFLDSDDYIAPQMLSVIDKYVECYDLDLLAFDCFRVDEDGIIIERVSVQEYQKEFTILTNKEFFLLEPTSCTKIYRRKLFIENKIMFPERLWYEDLATIFKLVPYAERIGYLKKTFYYYVQQQNSITHSTNTERMLEIIDAFNSEVVFFKEKGLFEEYYYELEWNCALHVLYYSAFRLLVCGYNRKKMLAVYKYSKSIFPNIENNIYVAQRKKTRYLMETVIDRKYFIFYLKEGFVGQSINQIKVILKSFLKK